MVLAGGLGTRLRPVIADKPKVLAPVNGRPFLEYILEQLVETGIKRVVLCTGYLAEQVEACFGTEYRGVQISYSREHALLGTGGALRFALPQVTTKTALVLNGDSFCEADLRKFYEWHCSKRSSASIMLTKVSDTKRYGQVNVLSDGRITAFEEKGTVSGPGSINAGVYLIASELLKTIPPGRNMSLEREIFPAWIASGLWGYEAAVANFIDIGTPKSLDEAGAIFHPPVGALTEL